MPTKWKYIFDPRLRGEIITLSAVIFTIEMYIHISPYRTLNCSLNCSLWQLCHVWLDRVRKYKCCSFLVRHGKKQHMSNAVFSHIAYFHALTRHSIRTRHHCTWKFNYSQRRRDANQRKKSKTFPVGFLDIDCSVTLSWLIEIIWGIFATRTSIDSNQQNLWCRQNGRPHQASNCDGFTMCNGFVACCVKV